MNGLLRRLRLRRAATADETPPEEPAASEPVDATATEITVEGADATAQDDERLRRRRDVPAGLDPDELETSLGETGRRGRIRKRVRYLRRAREVLLRDLGGFAYEVHRTAGGREHGGHREILERKAGRLAEVDRELRGLEARLGETHSPETVVREPGIGGTCPTCGELHGSDAGWCAHCGTPLTERARRRDEQEIDRAIAARQAAAAEQAREAERQREVAAAGAAAAAGEAASAAAAAPAPARDDSAASAADGPPAATGPDDSAASGGDDPTTVLGGGERPASEGDRTASESDGAASEGDGTAAADEAVPAERRS